MKYTRLHLCVSRAAILSLFTALLADNLAAQQSDVGNDRSMDADTARVIEYWNQARRDSAIPRDLVIDPRGLGYLRRQDGSLQPYGHEITAAASGSPTPQARPLSSGDDTTPPTISNMNPGSGAVIGASATFSATVTDAESGVRSVSFVVVYPDGITSQTFPASQTANDSWSVTLQGFTDGNWSWSVEARDRAKRGGNQSTLGPVPFTVDTGGGAGGGASDTVINAEWTSGGYVQTAAGRLYFEMPNNERRRGPWGAYVCSGTVVTETTSGRSIVLTAAHCVFDDVNKSYARNVLFIPDQAGTTGSGTDTNCANDPLGCWVPSFGVVDVEWTTRTFPDNIAWDYAYYVVDDTGAHAGNYAPDALDSAVDTLAVPFSTPYSDDTDPGASSVDFTHALGYSYSEDPKLMYCAEDMTTEGSVNWWLPSCGLSGGSSGGPWVQPMTAGDGPVISVNSWGYTNLPGMAGPRLDVSSAHCLMTMAESTPWSQINEADGEAGSTITCQ
jgi:hypothetical protein